MDNAKLSEAQQRALYWFARHGGSGYLDRYGRVVSGGETYPQGAWICWLHLIAKGLVSGAADRLELTELGRNHG